VVPESPLKRYKVFGIVTIIKEMDGGKLIHWLHKRCGRSEQIHTSQKLPKIIKKFPRFVLGGVSKKLGSGLKWCSYLASSILLWYAFSSYFNYNN
jgi:hypothetical protein